MIVLQHFNDFGEAQEVRRRLEAHGFHPVVVEDLVAPDSAVVATSPAKHGAEVQIPEAEAAQAIQIVDELDEAETDEFASGN